MRAATLDNVVRSVRGLLLAPLLMVAAVGPVYAEDASEAAVKVAFIFNFFKFIEWPAEATNRDKFLLCADGDGEVSQGLQMLDGKIVNGKPLSVRRNQQGEALRACHMVYMENPDTALLRDLRAYPVVTVGDGGDFIQQDGMIGLVPQDNRLSFEINLAPAQANGVKIRSPLLKLAKTVQAVK